MHTVVFATHSSSLVMLAGKTMGAARASTRRIMLADVMVLMIDEGGCEREA